MQQSDFYRITYIWNAAFRSRGFGPFLHFLFFHKFHGFCFGCGDRLGDVANMRWLFAAAHALYGEVKGS